MHLARQPTEGPGHVSLVDKTKSSLRRPANLAPGGPALNPYLSGMTLSGFLEGLADLVERTYCSASVRLLPSISLTTTSRLRTEIFAWLRPQPLSISSLKCSLLCIRPCGETIRREQTITSILSSKRHRTCYGRSETSSGPASYNCPWCYAIIQTVTIRGTTTHETLSATPLRWEGKSHSLITSFVRWMQHGTSLYYG